jgi:hypothetical protein
VSLGIALSLQGRAHLDLDQPAPAHTALQEAVDLLSEHAPTGHDTYVHDVLANQLDTARAALAKTRPRPAS